MNSKNNRNNTSGFRGVTRMKDRKKRLAQTTSFGKIVYLGCYDNILDAAEAYNRFVKKIYQEFAKK